VESDIPFSEATRHPGRAQREIEVGAMAVVSGFNFSTLMI
jgi:hypothetical protein